jgi:hypothetical protein
MMQPNRRPTQPNPEILDRLRATLSDIDRQLESNPSHLAAHEFRRFLLLAIRDVESVSPPSARLDTAA